MSSSLVALCAGRHMGRLDRDGSGRVSFEYDADWRRSDRSHPLSVSMPLAAPRHEHAVVEPFLWGLLPDNRAVLERWASRFGVSANSVFGLLGAVGEECAGAVQFVREERVDVLLAASSGVGDDRRRGDGDGDSRDAGRPAETDADSDAGGVEWLDERDVGRRLAALRRDASAGRSARDTGQFSLAGAQPKTALHRVGDRFGVPHGATPTTHILKPPLPEFAGHVENEHLCLALARRVGIPAAASEVQRFDGEVAIVVERFDRLEDRGHVRRVHQEDLCQALAVHPASKYQSEGGPTPAQIVALLREQSDEPQQDVRTFVRALIYNWIVGGTDAHAKNYGLLHAEGPVLRLAPVYDLASILPYDRDDPRRTKLAMKIGAHYRLCEVTENDWRRLGEEVGLDPSWCVEGSRRLRAEVRAGLGGVVEEALAGGLDGEPVRRLEGLLVERLDGLDGG